MYTYSVSGYDPNNKVPFHIISHIFSNICLLNTKVGFFFLVQKFSPCSIRSVRAVLLAKASKCFSSKIYLFYFFLSFPYNLLIQENCIKYDTYFFYHNFNSTIFINFYLISFKKQIRAFYYIIAVSYCVFLDRIVKIYGKLIKLSF